MNRLALSTVATRMSFVVLPWLALTTDLTWTQVGLVAAAQLFAYLIVTAISAQWKAAWLPIVADMASAVAIGGVAFVYRDYVQLMVAAAVIGALRGLGDRARGTEPSMSDEDATPSREWLHWILLLVIGAVAGLGAAWLGATGVLWLTGMLFVLCAALPVGETDVDGPPLRSVWRLALIVFGTNLLAQTVAVLLMAVWLRDLLGDPDTLGLLGGAAVLGAVGGALVWTMRAFPAGRYLAAVIGFLGAGGALLIVGGLAPALMLVVAVAIIVGAALASVTPVVQGSGPLSVIPVLALPFGTVAGLWLAMNSTLLRGVLIAIGLFAVAMLMPMLPIWPREGIPKDQPLAYPARLPARLSVTLAYADGQWLIEVRKGRALLGTRYLVKSAEALNMLAILDVPGVHARVEEALAVDQTEAARQAERIRGELAELEAKLADLSEMSEISNLRKDPTSPSLPT